MPWLLLALGVVVGAVLGLTGAGGGILAVPALMTGTGWSLQEAAPVALIAVAIGAGVGAIEGLRRGIVRYRAAMLIAVASLPFTGAGLQLAQWLPQRALLLAFAATVLVAASRMLRRAPIEAEHGIWCGHIDPATGRFAWNWPTALLFGGIGAVSGLITGMLGVGGGFVIVPALRRFTDMTMHAVVATSLLIVALVSAGGIATAWLHGAQLSPLLALPFAAGTALGMLGGRTLTRHLDARHVQTIFGLALLVLAAALVAKALT